MTGAGPSRPAAARARGTEILLIILVIATGLRLYNLGSQCFWFDELLTVELINGHGHPNVQLPRNVLMEHPPGLTDPKLAAPWWAIWNNLSGYGDVHPPLYFILCRWWRDWVGNSEAAIRLLSVVFSVAAIAFLYRVVRDLSGARVALWSAALMACAAPQVSYAQEARGYSLLIFVLLLAAIALVRIEQRGLSILRWLGLTAALLATALTHYFSFGVLVALTIYALLVFRRRLLGAVIGAFAAAAGFFVLMWGKNLLAQRPMLLHDYPMYADPRGHTQITLLRAAALPVRHLLGLNLGTGASIAAACALVLAGVLSIFFRRRDLLLWWLWLVGAIVTVMMIDLARTAEQLTMVKYTFAAAPAACALAAGCVPAKFRRMRHLVPLLMLGCELYFLPAAYKDWKGDWRGMAQYVIATTAAEDPVVIAGDGTGRRTLSWVYLGMNIYVNPWPRALSISDRQPSPALVDQLRRYSHVTLVTDCLAARPADILPGFIPDGEPKYFSNIGLIWPMARR